MGKWGIGCIHFLIPLLVGILIFGTLGFAQNAEAVIMKLKDYSFYNYVEDVECAWIDFQDEYCHGVFRHIVSEGKKDPEENNVSSLVTNSVDYQGHLGDPDERTWKEGNKPAEDFMHAGQSAYRFPDHIEFFGSTLTRDIDLNLPRAQSYYIDTFEISSKASYSYDGTVTTFTSPNEMFTGKATFSLFKGTVDDPRQTKIFEHEWTENNDEREVSGDGVLEPGRYQIKFESFSMGTNENVWGFFTISDKGYAELDLDFFVTDPPEPSAMAGQDTGELSIQTSMVGCPSGMIHTSGDRCVGSPTCPKDTFFDGTNCTAPPPNSCPPGTDLVDGACIGGKLKSCPSGTGYFGDHCVVPIALPCKEGFNFNFIDLDCEATPISDCSAFPGTTQNIFGDCEIDSIKTCPANMSPIADNPLVCTSSAECPSGFPNITGTCTGSSTCSTGNNIAGTCTTASTTGTRQACNEVCAFGLCEDVCVPVPTTSCPDSSWTNLGPTCTREASCPSGFTHLAGTCTKTATCPSGATNTLGVCTSDVIASCPSGSGTSWNGLVCVAIPDKSCPPPSELKSPKIGIPEIGILPIGGEMCKMPFSQICPSYAADPSDLGGVLGGVVCTTTSERVCPQGTSFDGQVCKGKVSCPPGTSFDSKNNRCQSTPSCGSDASLDSETKLCTLSLTEFGIPKLPDDGLQGSELSIPDWVKNTAGWWSERSVDDSDFTGGISYLIEEDIISIPDLPVVTEAAEENVPDWVRNMAGWWADNLTTDQEFADAIKFLVEKGIIQVQT